MVEDAIVRLCLEVPLGRHSKKNSPGPRQDKDHQSPVEVRDLSLVFFQRILRTGLNAHARCQINKCSLTVNEKPRRKMDGKEDENDKEVNL